MRYFDVSTLTLKHVQIFLAAAKYENFSIAAESLNVTQPLVSRTISILEQYFGFPLFMRDRRRVYLTPAGKTLHSQWQRLYAFVEKSIEIASEAYESSRSILSISDDWISSKSKYLTPIAKEFSARFPDIELRIDQMSPEAVVSSVTSGQADVGFLMLPEVVRLDGTDTTWRLIKESPFCADVAPSNPLYSRDKVTISDFEGVPITLLSNTIASVYTKTIMDLFANAGFTPQIRSYVASNSAFESARVRGESGAAIVNDLIPLVEGTKRIPIEGTRTGLAIFWRSSNVGVPLKNFISTAVEVMDGMQLDF